MNCSEMLSSWPVTGHWSVSHVLWPCRATSVMTYRVMTYRVDRAWWRGASVLKVVACMSGSRQVIDGVCRLCSHCI